MSSTTRPVVFMDINIGETPAGRLKMELFSDIVPKYYPPIGYGQVDNFFIPPGQPKTSGSCVQVNTGEPLPCVPYNRLIRV